MTLQDLQALGKPWPQRSTSSLVLQIRIGPGSYPFNHIPPVSSALLEQTMVLYARTTGTLEPFQPMVLLPPPGLWVSPFSLWVVFGESRVHSLVFWFTWTQGRTYHIPGHSIKLEYDSVESLGRVGCMSTSYIHQPETTTSNVVKSLGFVKARPVSVGNTNPRLARREDRRPKTLPRSKILPKRGLSENRDKLW